MEPSVEFSNSFQEKILALLDSANPGRNDEAEISEKWFNKLKKRSACSVAPGKHP